MTQATCARCGSKLNVPTACLRDGSAQVRCSGCGDAVTVVSAADGRSNAAERFMHVSIGVMCLAGTAILGGLLVVDVLTKPAPNAPTDASQTHTSTYQPSPAVVYIHTDKATEARVEAVATPPSPQKTEATEPAATAQVTETPAATVETPAVVEAATSAPAGLSVERLNAMAAASVAHVTFHDERGQLIGEATGFFVSPDGLLVTNHPAARHAAAVTAETAEGTTMDALYVSATDRDTDLALLQVDGENLPYLKMGATVLPGVGDAVYAVDLDPRGAAIAAGAVKGMHRHYTGAFQVIETTAPVRAGSSGAPLLSADGRVIGVTSHKLSIGPDANYALPTGKIGELIIARANGTPRALAAAEVLNGRAFHFVSDRGDDTRLRQLEAEFGVGGREPAPAATAPHDAEAAAKARAAEALSPYVGTDLMPDPATAQEVGVRLADLRETGIARPRDPHNFDDVPTFDLNIMSHENATVFQQNMRRTHRRGEFDASMEMMRRGMVAAWETRDTADLYGRLDFHWDFMRYQSYGGSFTFNQFQRAAEVAAIPPYLRGRAPGTGTGWGMSVSPGIPGGRVPRLAPRYDHYPSPGEQTEPEAPAAAPNGAARRDTPRHGDNDLADARTTPYRTVYLSATPVTATHVMPTTTTTATTSLQAAADHAATHATARPSDDRLNDAYVQAFRKRWGKYPWQF
ncbi:MAG: hypothetical protein GC159_03135 [Phycisphaera sp.]|nr:hypothetical protein [Phycisphaera sp.]